MLTFFTKVSAIGHELLIGILVLGHKAMVGPFPGKSTLKGWMLVEDINVLLDVARTIAHGMYLFIVSFGNGGSA